MHVYTFYGTDNAACNIRPNSDICISIDKKQRLKLRSCYATWRTSPIKEIKVFDDMLSKIIHIYTANSTYSIMCSSFKEARMLADTIREHLV